MSTENPSEKQSRQEAVQKAEAVKQTYEHMLLAKQNVVGVGVGLRQVQGVWTNTISLVVMVRKKLPASQLSPDDLIPAEIEGVPVDVQEVGELTAQ